MMEGWVNCPLCGCCNLIESFFHLLSGTKNCKCEECGSKFEFDFEVYMDIRNVVPIDKGTDLNED